MRTITKSAALRFEAQKEEAKLLNEEKIATSIEKSLEKYANAQRNDEDFYVYSQDQLKTDVNQALWDAAIRASDFYGTALDAKKIQESIDKVADIFLDEMRVVSGNLDGVGAYEKLVPGENRTYTALEVDDTE